MTDVLTKEEAATAAAQFDNVVLADHLRDQSRLLHESDEKVDGTLLARMADVAAAQATVRLKKTASNAAWRLCVAATQVELLRAQLTSAQGDLARVTAERDGWRDALDQLHVVNWIGVIDGLTPYEAVQKLLELALDQERDDLTDQLATARADLATAEQEKQRLQAERDRLARTLANDPNGAAKKLINLAKMYTFCDRCEQETTEQNESNIVCDACLAKSEQAREALQARINGALKFLDNQPPFSCAILRDILTGAVVDAPDGGR